MNKTQKIIIALAATVTVAMILFPPWFATNADEAIIPKGYMSLFEGFNAAILYINYGRLFSQCLIVAVLAVGLVFALKAREQ